MSDPAVTKQRRRPIMRWIHRGFLLWAVVSTLWLANSMRTRGVDAALLRSDAAVTVEDGATTLDFLPVASTNGTGLIFICGSGVAAQAYAPLLRPIAEAGYAVFIIKLRWVEINGGNHSQFGHYGHQLFDGKATSSREAQQALARSALLEALNDAAK